MAQHPFGDVNVAYLVTNEGMKEVRSSDEEPLGIWNSDLRKPAPIDFCILEPASLIPKSCLKQLLLGIQGRRIHLFERY